MVYYYKIGQELSKPAEPVTDWNVWLLVYLYLKKAPLWE